MNGDCLELMKDIPSGSVDMVLCDLPYGTTQCKWDSCIDLDALWIEYNRITKPNAAILLFAQAPFSAHLMMSNIKNFRYELVWAKNRSSGYLNANRMPLKKHENIYVFYRKLPTYFPQKSTGHANYQCKPSSKFSGYGEHKKMVTTVMDGTRYPSDVISMPMPSGERGMHPTQKPVQLLEYLIKTYTRKGDVVLDNCMGSGSTGVAAVKCGNRFIGIEKDDHYYLVAKERINAACKEV